MSKEDLILFASLGGLVIAILGFLYQREASIVMTGGPSPFDVDLAGPSIRYGDNYRGGYGGAGLGGVGGSACGCGGSLNTQPAAVPAYDLLERMQQTRLPYGQRPKPVSAVTVPLLTNGASV